MLLLPPEFGVDRAPLCNRVELCHLSLAALDVFLIETRPVFNFTMCPL